MTQMLFPVLMGTNKNSSPPFSVVQAQVLAILQIMRRLGWTWVGLLYSDDSYGHDVAQIFQTELGRSGLGCLAYAQLMPWDSDPAQLSAIVSMMRRSTARVVVVIVYGTHLVKLMDEVGTAELLL